MQPPVPSAVPVLPIAVPVIPCAVPATAAPPRVAADARRPPRQPRPTGRLRLWLRTHPWAAWSLLAALTTGAAFLMFIAALIGPDVLDLLGEIPARTAQVLRGESPRKPRRAATDEGNVSEQTARTERLRRNTLGCRPREVVAELGKPDAVGSSDGVTADDPAYACTWSYWHLLRDPITGKCPTVTITFEHGKAVRVRVD